MHIEINKASKTPLYKQIAEQIKTGIKNEELPNGYILPPERKLAEKLGVNRTTILNAYRNLKAEGLLSSKVGQGTTIIYEKTEQPKLKKQVIPMYYHHLYSPVGRYQMSDFEKELLKTTNVESVISFAVGILNLEENGPVEAAMKTLLESVGTSAVKHTPYTGIYPLKTSIRAYMAPYDIKCSDLELMVISGAQQGISLVSDLFINPKDVVVVEDPTYFFAKQIFEAKGAQVIGIPMEEDGMDLKYLEQILKTTQVKLIYTMPNYHNPTNYNTSTEKKVKLLQLAYAHQLVVLEDGAYNDLSFSGRKPVTLKSMDYNQQVIYLGTFSKVVAMGLRLGYMIAPKEIIERASYIKHLQDIHTASLSQWLVYILLKDQGMEQIIGNLSKNHYKKLKVFTEQFEALDLKAFGLSYREPTGGIYLWVHMADHMDVTKLLEIAKEEGVVFVPGKLFFVNQYNSCIRINYVYETDDRIRAGLTALKKALIIYNQKTKGGVEITQSEGPGIL